MQKKRYTEIQIETYETRRIRFPGNPLAPYGEQCRQHVSAFRPDQISALLQTTVEDVYRMIDTKRFHLVRIEGGLRLVCGSSPSQGPDFARATKSTIRSKTMK